MNKQNHIVGRCPQCGTRISERNETPEGFKCDCCESVFWFSELAPVNNNVVLQEAF